MSTSPLPLSAQTFFQTILPAVLQERSKQQVLPKLVVAFQIVGEQGGVWTLRCDGKSGQVQSDDAADAQLRFILGDRILADLMSGALDPQTALTTRAVTIQGDTSLLNQLAFLFAPPKAIWQRF